MKKALKDKIQFAEASGPYTQDLCRRQLAVLKSYQDILGSELGSFSGEIKNKWIPTDGYFFPPGADKMDQALIEARINFLIKLHVQYQEDRKTWSELFNRKNF